MLVGIQCLCFKSSGTGLRAAPAAALRAGFAVRFGILPTQSRFRGNDEPSIIRFFNLVRDSP